MSRKISILLALFLSFSVSLIATTADNWNILNQIQNRPLGITLKNYCESWRMNVELHNIWDFEVVPAECTEYIGKYMSSSQYTVNSKRAIDECTVFLSTSCSLKNDGKDAWIFDIDDTLLSTVPYYKQHNYGGEKLNLTALEEWMLKGEAPVLEHTKGLFNVLKAKGVKIFLISGRREHLRAATVDNLLDVEIHGWTDLILRKLHHSTHHGTKSTFFEFFQKLLSFLRGPSSKDVSVKQYKIAARKQLIDQGYRILGIVGSQWSSIDGLPTANRTFKLPNSIYIVA